MTFPIILAVGVALCLYLYRHGRKGDAYFGAVVLGLCTLVHVFIALSNAMRGDRSDLGRHDRNLTDQF